MARGGKSKDEHKIRCECGNVGTISYEENESPPHHGKGGYDSRKLLELSDNFKHGHGDNPEIYCGKCNATVKT